MKLLILGFLLIFLPFLLNRARMLYSESGNTIYLGLFIFFALFWLISAYVFFQIE